MASGIWKAAIGMTARKPERLAVQQCQCELERALCNWFPPLANVCPPLLACDIQFPRFWMVCCVRNLSDYGCACTASVNAV